MKPNLNQLLKLLIEGQFEFVVIGGFAGVLHGSTLVTRDLDLCLWLSPDNIERLRRALKPLHPKHQMTPQRISFLENPTDLKEVKVVDFVSDVTGVGDFKRVVSHAETIELFGLPCKVISKEDLIASKQAMGREKDIAMIREIQAIQKRKKKS